MNGFDLSTISAAYLGSTPINEIYFGSTKIWPAGVTPVPVGTVFNFAYTGTVQSKQLPAGTYKLQCWGAQGGSSTGNYAATGSKGGYSEGVLILTQTTTLYIFVGGAGMTIAGTSGTTSIINGGWNGGGGAKPYASGSSRYCRARPGGGADIALVTSTMNYSSYRTNRSSESLLSRIIVAGGGAGSCVGKSSTTVTSQGEGFGGGTSGGGRNAGTQSAAGNTSAGFGYGSTSNVSNGYITGGAGGGGWYGGSSGGSSNNAGQATGGSGGSGFVNIAANAQYRPSGYTGLELDSGATTAGDSSFESVDGNTETGHEGDGYARITRINDKVHGFTFSAQSISVAANGQVTQITVTSDYAWTATTESDWITISPSSSNTTDTTVTITIAANSSDVRSGSVVFSDGEVTATVLVSQEAASQYQPLTFDILGSGTIGWKAQNSSLTKTIQYKKNDGEWTSITSTTSGVTFSVANGDVVQFRGDNTAYGNASYYNRFTATCQFKVRGNIMSLINSTSFSSLTTLSDTGALRTLFYQNTYLIDASKLLLPATTLSARCYQGLFNGCTNLTAVPVLPAATLASNAYNNLFNACSSLTYIKCLATDISASNCTSNWVNGVAATGTFVKASTMSSWTTGISGIPSGWTVENA